MSYIGNTSTTQTYAAAIDYFSGNGSTTAFTLSKPVAATPQIQVVVNNVPQNPGTAFTVSGSTLTFTSAPSTGSNNIYVYYTSPVTQVIAPSAGTVQSSSIASGGPTWDASGNVSTYNGANISAGNTFGFKNRIINGAMMIDQRNAGASVTPVDGQYVVDRFNFGLSQASKLTAQQSTVAPTGFVNSFLITSTSAYSVGASDRFLTSQAVEGLNCADLGWGAAGAATVTLSFWVRSSLTGTFGGAVRNSAVNRSYPFSYTINAANTWEQKSITIAGDTTGTWLTTNGAGLYLTFSLGAGSTLSNTAGSWYAGNYVSATGATSVVGTSGATFYITGVQLEKGSVATPFDFRSYGTELSLCQRYYYRVSSATTYPAVGSGVFTNSTACRIYVQHPMAMRTAPTTGFGGTNVNWNGATNGTITSIVSTYGSPTQSMLDLGAGSNGSVAQGCVVYTNPGAANYFDFSAEL